MEDQKQVVSSTAASIKMEVQLRDRIKELQEKRAAGLMAEISELRKEKSFALTQVKKMDNIVADIRKENALMKKKEINFVNSIQTLERSLWEEKLINENLKKKCQLFDKKNKELTKKFETQSFLSPHRDLTSSDRSHSLTDLTEGNRENESPISSKRLNLTNPQLSISSLSSPFTSPASSPTVIHRKYRLATIQTLEKETQTEESSRITEFSGIGENLPRSVLEILAAAREDIIRLQKQKKDLQKQLHRMALEKREVQEIRQAQVETLSEEADVLRESLSQFSSWAQNKIAVIEEDMDLCKVVYSLHGSLSKESIAIEEMSHKLSLKESSLQEERTINKHLIKAVNETEEQLKQLQLENNELRQQIHVHYATISNINDLKLFSHGRNLSLPSPLAKHRRVDRSISRPIPHVAITSCSSPVI